MASKSAIRYIFFLCDFFQFKNFFSVLIRLILYSFQIVFFCAVEGAPKYAADIFSLSKQHWDPKIPKKNCAEWYASGHVYDGVYSVEVGGKKFPVYCDMLEDQGGWTVIQKSVPSEQK